MLTKQTNNALATYSVHIIGVTFDVNLPIALIPPIIVNQVIIATIKPKIQPLFANILLSQEYLKKNLAAVLQVQGWSLSNI